MKKLKFIYYTNEQLEEAKNLINDNPNILKENTKEGIVFSSKTFEDNVNNFEEYQSLKTFFEENYNDNFMLAQKLYAMLDIEEKEAIDLDCTIWSTLSIEYFRNYVDKRWFSKSKNITNEMINKRYFSKNKLKYCRNSIARLWWTIHQTKVGDDYKLAEIILNRSQFEQSIMEAAFSDNKDFLIKFLKTIVIYEQEYGMIDAKLIIKITKHFNRLTGGMVVDNMEEEEIYNIFIDLTQK